MAEYIEKQAAKMEGETMNELISKHEAYMLIKHEAETHELPASKEAYERTAQIVDQMRPVNIALLEQKTGRWLNTDTIVWDAKDEDGEQELEISIVAAKCSVCERWAEQVNKFPPSMTYNFCPTAAQR